MPLPFPECRRPGLLVSVRNAGEAVAALEGGADVIDVKEPDRGSLGAADIETIAGIASTVDGRATVTAAAGELVELLRHPYAAFPEEVALAKIGLSDCRSLRDWNTQWQQVAGALWRHNNAARRTVAVVYADWTAANSPEPQHVLDAAVSFGCPALLVDTWDKSSGSLFDIWPAAQVLEFAQAVQRHHVKLVLAGSLSGDSFVTALQLQPDLVAVRTAACERGRLSDVSRSRVASLRKEIAAVALQQVGSSLGAYSPR